MTDNQTESVYRVIQLGPPRDPNGHQANEPVTGLDSLVTHHPNANRNAHMQDGRIVSAEPRRAHAIVGGEVQEIEISRNGRTYGLKPDQVLLKKDFILEDSNLPYMSRAARAVDIPSPIAGYIGRVSEREGLVDILDRQGGDVIARVRHMHPIHVYEGQTVAYGEGLGTQSRQQTGAVHVHMEMDTRYYQQYENYVADLVSGRLPVQAEYRQNIQPLPITDDGTLRLGESDSRILDLQRVLVNEGYTATGSAPLDQDGVYRLSMQGALLDFQRAHGIPQTGDIDPVTLRFAPTQAAQFGPPPIDHELPGRHGQPGHMRPPVPTAPGHPNHPDHRPSLPDPLPPPVNQRGQVFGTGDTDLDRLAAALFANDDRAISTACERIATSLSCQIAIEHGQSLHATQLADERQQALQIQVPVRTM